MDTMTNNKDFGIVTACDKNYFPGVVALIKSINLNSPLPVSVIDQGMTPDQLKQIRTLGANPISVDRCIKIDDERFGCCYVLFDIDMAPYENILYLDADMIVFDDLSHLGKLIAKHGMLWSISNPAKLLRNKRYRPKIYNLVKNIKNIENSNEFYREYKNYCGKNLLRRRNTRLNSGILGVKKDLMRKIKKEIPKYNYFLDKFKYPDQDLLSLIKSDLGIKGYQLSYEYNACKLHIKSNKICNARFDNEHLYISENTSIFGLRPDNLKIKILHYNNHEKPWLPNSSLKEGFKEIWEYYYNL